MLSLSVVKVLYYQKFPRKSHFTASQFSLQTLEIFFLDFENSLLLLLPRRTYFGNNFPGSFLKWASHKYRTHCNKHSKARVRQRPPWIHTQKRKLYKGKSAIKYLPFFSEKIISKYWLWFRINVINENVSVKKKRSY